MKKNLPKNLLKILSSILIVATLVFFVPKTAEAATLGNTNIGASSAATANVICSKFTTTEAATVTSMTMYANQDTGNTVAGAIYTDNGSSYPNAKIAEDTGNTTGTGVAAWLTVNISASLSASTAYWFCTWASDSRTVYWDAGSTNQYVTQGMTFETWANPFTAGGTQFARALSVYVNYTPTTLTTPAPSVVLSDGQMIINGQVIIK